MKILCGLKGGERMLSVFIPAAAGDQCRVFREHLWGSMVQRKKWSRSELQNSVSQRNHTCLIQSWDISERETMVLSLVTKQMIGELTILDQRESCVCIHVCTSCACACVRACVYKLVYVSTCVVGMCSYVTVDTVHIASDSTLHVICVGVRAKIPHFLGLVTCCVKLLMINVKWGKPLHLLFSFSPSVYSLCLEAPSILLLPSYCLFGSLLDQPGVLNKVSQRHWVKQMQQ